MIFNLTTTTEEY